MQFKCAKCKRNSRIARPIASNCSEMSSRGAEMQQAAARAAGAADQPQDAAEAQETVPEMVLTEDNAAVLDMQGLLTLPVEEGEPIDSLRMLLVPKGKSARVSSRPGHYVVDGP